MSPEKNGHGGSTPAEPARARRHDPSAPETPAMDPIYDVPLVGRIVKEADAIRAKMPFAARFNSGEADLLRMEARALRLAANYLEQRARQVENLSRGEERGRSAVRRIPVE